MRTMPTTRVLTRTSGAHSTAIERARFSRPALAAPYAAVPGEGRLPLTLPIITTAPRARLRCSYAAREAVSGASEVQLEYARVPFGVRVGQPPVGGAARVVDEDVEPGQRGEEGAYGVGGSRRSSGANSASSAAGLRAVCAHRRRPRAPASTKARAIPAPTPRVPPVTTATFPFSSISLLPSHLTNVWWKGS